MPTTWHAAAVVCCAILAPQQPPAVPAPQAAAPGAVAGVVKSVSGAAIARARIIAQPAGDAPPHVAMSGKDGAYILDDLPPGAYTITASKTGFAAQTYGERRTEAAQPFSVTAGRRATGIDFALSPAGVIPGRILDEDGSPLAGARVEALQSRYENGQHVLKPVATTTTDDRGAFRLFGVAPGEYYVSAFDPAFDAVGSARGAQHYAPTYFPGTSFSDEAQPVVVPARGDARPIEFTLRIVPPADVRGQLLTYDKRPLLSGAVIMTPKEGNGVPVAEPETVSILPNGRFHFGNVLPGHYTIRARGITEPNGLALFAEYAVQVQGEDIAGLEMTLQRGSLLDGTVSLAARHGAAPPALTELRVRAPFPDGSDFGDALTGTVAANGRFAIRGLMHGDHQLVLKGLERPWVVQSMKWRGHDITDELIPVDEDSAYRDVQVILTDEAADVSGTVRSADDALARDAGVLIYPVAAEFWIRTDRRLQAARTDDEGRYSVYGLPPGEYLAVAAYELDEGDLGRTRQLEHLRAFATPLHVGAADAHVTLDLRLASTIGVADPTRTAAR